MKNIFIIDKCNRRSFYLYDLLKDSGETVFDFNMDTLCKRENERFVYIFSPAKTITEKDIALIDCNSIVFYGKCDCKDKALKKNVLLMPLLSDELYVYYNSKITAEGAIQLAMTNTDTALYETYVLILGYGRLGKACAKMFSGLAKAVSVATYNEGEYHSAQANYLTYFERSYLENMGGYDIIVNTIPAIILSADDLPMIKEGSLLIDLASAPSGVDVAGLKEVNINYMLAQSLPDKVAPKTASQELHKSILRRLSVLDGKKDK